MRTLQLLVVVGAVLYIPVTQADDNRSTAEEVFEERLMPIFRSENPSSCVQCHLSSVDLKDYILPSHEKTFLSLRDQGLIDVKNPTKSKILTLIRMGDRDTDERATRLHEKTRRAEYEAFKSWIVSSSQDETLVNKTLASLKVKAGPASPDAVIRHARKSRVVDSFVRTIWSQRMRCFPCHTPHEIDDDNQKHQKARQNHEKLLEQYGPRMLIFKATPERTLDYLIAKSKRTQENELPLINISDPSQSLLLLKPTSKLPKKNEDGTFPAPSSVLPVSHMGGLKMHKNDHSYKSFSLWLRDYSRISSNSYKSVAQLPQDNWQASQLVVRVRHTPKAWVPGESVQLMVHSWDNKKEQWSTEPVAFTQGTVTPRGMLFGVLFILGTPDAATVDPEQVNLPPGRYLVKSYRDSKKKLAADPTVMLTTEDFAGEASIKANWNKGFPNAEWIKGESFH